MKDTQEKAQQAKQRAVEKLNSIKAQQLRTHKQLLKTADKRLQAREQQLETANQRLRAHEQQLKAANQQLRAREQQLEAANQQLQAHEQQLEATNQRLLAHEQQLKAANQQLRAREQQLEAANQQLQAHEQQLKAANQLLEAREQQLKAANQQLLAHEQQLRAANQQLLASEQQLKAANQQLEASNQQLRATEKQVREERDRRQKYFDVAGTVMIVIDPEQKVVLVNGKGCEVLGYREEEVLGRNWFDSFLPKRVREKTRVTFEKLINGEAGLMEYNENLVLTKSGEEKIVDWHNVAVTDDEGNIVEILASGMDITERKRAEEALAHSEAIYRRTIENSHGVPYQLSFADGKYVFMGSGVEELVGIAAEELTLESLKEISKETIICDLCGYESLEAYCEAFESGKIDHFEADVCVHTPQGEIKWFNDCSLAVRDEETGELTGSIGILQDITERKRAEKQLQGAKEAAESANKTKSQFLANMSHEIRTPMNAIIGMSKTLREYNAYNLSVKQLEGLEIIYRSGQRLLLLINDILDLSKIEAGKMEVNLKAFSLNALIATIRSMVQTLCGDKSEIKFSVEKNDSVPGTIISDAQKLHEIFTNIISNAVKFTDKGEIVLKIYVEQDRLCFEVSDTGIGISKDDVEHIFEEFTQVDSSTTRKYPGTGLGLAICKKTVELLGGEIKAESELGKGTTIMFHVPLKSKQVLPDDYVTEPLEYEVRKSDIIRKHPESSFESRSPGNFAKILIAEDDRFGRAAIEMMLEHKYQLVFAKDGKEAVEKYFTVSPDMVLMDIMMPVMDGYQAFDEIIKNRSKHTIPIIAITAKAMIDDREELLAYGFTDYISKPINDESLVRIIEKHLAKQKPDNSTSD
ncbi:MAG: hybrid sensor histidine kinase/response regulator [Planctomycetota bacterium]|jgi:PAS domain S-box-containing protein